MKVRENWLRLSLAVDLHLPPNVVTHEKKGIYIGETPSGKYGQSREKLCLFLEKCFLNLYSLDTSYFYRINIGGFKHEYYRDLQDY